MKSAEESMEILEAFDLTRSFRGAAELAGCSHNTVARLVAKRPPLPDGPGSTQIPSRSWSPTALEVVDETACNLTGKFTVSRGSTVPCPSR